MHAVTLHFTASDHRDAFLVVVGEILAEDPPSMCTRSKIKDRVIATYMVDAPGIFDAVERTAKRFCERVQSDAFKLVYVRSNGVTMVLRDTVATTEKARITSDPADRRSVGRRTTVVEHDPRIDRSDPVQAAAEDRYTVEQRIASAMDEARELVEEAF